MARPIAAPFVAVDLGSNSFHMVVARHEQGHLRVVDRLRERVALGAGLGDDGSLDAGAQERALECLRRFGQRVRHVPARNVRAVGTNALRAAKDARTFLARAERALGHAIDVVPGREEARLVYLGVAHTEPRAAGRRLVVDVGGGSTEVVVGERFEPLRAESLYMGCVSWTRRFFGGGRVTRKAMRRARIAARLEVRTIARPVRALGWDEAFASSGTALAVANALGADGEITRDGLASVADALLRAGRADRVELPGIDAERAEVLAGGVAILEAVFDGLRVQRMRASQGALREGVLYDLVGRLRHEDARDRTIRAFARRHHVDEDQAARVERTALRLLAQAAGRWKLRRDEHRDALSWAARLHEVGLAVAYSGHHKHGDYLIRNSDMPGFSRQDQELVATLVRWHRRRLDAAAFETLSGPLAGDALRLCLLLRLAVRLHRSRAPRTPEAALRAGEDRVALRFPKGWLDRHPLTRADLDDEARELGAAGVTLDVR